ncbi:MAG TPA: hypothetical protein VK154_04360 [Chitinophagales bacterium]|nr:hypothetical protein [Chitinophagales bacterium]
MNALPRFTYTAFFFTLMIISSCKPTRKEILYNQNLIDSVTQFETGGVNPIEKTACVIANTGAGSFSFYITPAEVDMLNSNSIAASLVNSSMTDEQKCLALWKFVCKWRYHSPNAPTYSAWPHTPAALFNSLQCGICDDAAASLGNLGAQAGLNTRVVALKEHVVTEFYYNKAWHMFDADREIYYRDNKGAIAGVEQLKANTAIFDLPQVNSFHSALVYNTINNRNKKAILQSGKLHNAHYLRDKHPTYSSALTLNKGESIRFSVEPVSPIMKKLFVDVLENGGPYYRTAGTLTRHFETNLSPGGITYSESMPYAINRVMVGCERVKSSPPTKVFYSPDSVHWYFKGIVSENSRVTFDPRIMRDHEIVLNYYLKFVPERNSDMEGKTDMNLEIKNDFVFSDKLFFNNNLHSFKVKSLTGNYRAIKIELDCERKQ